MGKKILFVSRHAPYGSSTAREALDAILAAAVYDQALSVLFMDDGVFQLLNGQEAKYIAQKSLSASIPVLPLYGVEKIYVHRESLEKRQLESSELVLEDIHLISGREISQLFQEQEQILSF